MSAPLQSLKSAEKGKGGRTAGVTLGDLEKCFQTLPQTQRHGSLPPDASYIVIQPSSPIMSAWDWMVRSG